MVPRLETIKPAQYRYFVAEFRPVQNIRTNDNFCWQALPEASPQTTEIFRYAEKFQYWHYCQVCMPTYLQFPYLFSPCDINKYIGGSKGAPPPIRTKIFLISCSFLGTSGKFVCWRPSCEESWIPPEMCTRGLYFMGVNFIGLVNFLTYS